MAASLQQSEGNSGDFQMHGLSKMLLDFNFTLLRNELSPITFIYK